MLRFTWLEMASLTIWMRIYMHPLATTTPWHAQWAAGKMLLIDFHGQTAHAGVCPWEGRSALHAAELFAHGVALMREHLEVLHPML